MKKALHLIPFLLILGFGFSSCAKPDLIVKSAELGTVTQGLDSMSYSAPLTVIVKNQGGGKFKVKMNYDVVAVILAPGTANVKPEETMVARLYFSPFGSPGTATVNDANPIKQDETFTMDTVPEKNASTKKTVTAYFKCPWKGQELDMEVWVDKGNKVKESDNKNNRATFKVLVP